MAGKKSVWRYNLLVVGIIILISNMLQGCELNNNNQSKGFTELYFEQKQIILSPGEFTEIRFGIHNYHETSEMYTYEIAINKVPVAKEKIEIKTNEKKSIKKRISIPEELKEKNKISIVLVEEKLEIVMWDTRVNQGE